MGPIACGMGVCADCVLGVNGQHIWINPTTRVVIVKFSSYPISADIESAAIAISAMDDAIARKLGE